MGLVWLVAFPGAGCAILWVTGTRPVVSSACSSLSSLKKLICTKEVKSEMIRSTTARAVK